MKNNIKHTPCDELMFYNLRAGTSVAYAEVQKPFKMMRPPAPAPVMAPQGGVYGNVKEFSQNRGPAE